MVKRGSGMDYYIQSPLYGGRTPFANNQGAAQERFIQQNIERNIAELAVNRFKWSGLPDSIDPRFLEITLLMNGLSVFYWERDYDKLLAVKGAPSGYYNFMDWPVSYQIIGPGTRESVNGIAPNYMQKTLSGFMPFIKKDNKEERDLAFPVWANYFRNSDYDTIEIYSKRLATTDRTLEINTKNARRNKVVTSTTNNKLSMVNMVRQIDEGVEVIQAKDSAMPDNIQAIDLGVDYHNFTELSVLRSRWWNECMGMLGIDNANQDKKERLVAAEVGANDSQTDSMRFVALNARREGIAHINRVFNLNISVEFNVEVERQAQEMAQANNIDPNESKKKDDE